MYGKVSLGNLIMGIVKFSPILAQNSSVLWYFRKNLDKHNTVALLLYHREIIKLWIEIVFNILSPCGKNSYVLPRKLNSDRMNYSRF